MMASSFATPYVMDPLLETSVLRECQFHVFWVGHKILGGNTAGGVHLLVNVVIESPLVSDVPKCLRYLVFEFIGRVLCDWLVSVGVSQ